MFFRYKRWQHLLASNLSEQNDCMFIGLSVLKWLNFKCVCVGGGGGGQKIRFRI